VKLSRPLSVTVPDYGVLFAESVHASDFEMAERSDSFHKVLYVLDGRTEYSDTSQSPAPMAPGTVLMVPRQTRHRLRDLEPSTLLLLCFTERYLSLDPDLPQLWKTLTGQSRRIELTRPARERAERMWRRAMLEKTFAGTGGGVTVRTLAAQLLVLLARQQSIVAAQEPLVRVAAVARELRETFYDDWNVDRAAARAGLSRRRFTDLFRTATGRTFADELTDLRLSHAAHLLRAGEHSILGVMFSCGFGDVSHFYRLFRQRYGAPPKRWLQDQSREAANPPLRKQPAKTRAR
jgi:AraC-like DNA-binding protein